MTKTSPLRRVSTIDARRGNPAPRRTRDRIARMLELDPDLACGLDEAERRTARQECRVHVRHLAAGELRLPDGGRPGGEVLGLIVVDGVLARESALGHHRSLELLCPGDVLLAPDGASEVPLQTGGVVLTALCETSVMVLGPGFASAAARWPSLLATVHQRLEAQRERLAVQGLAMHLPRSEHRVLLTLWLLADRCGRMTPQGIVLPLDFTHDCLSQMTAARRPTVTLALRALEASGCLARTEEGHLILTDVAEREVAAVTEADRGAPIGRLVRFSPDRPMPHEPHAASAGDVAAGA